MMRLGTFDIKKDIIQYEKNENLDKYFILEDIDINNSYGAIENILNPRGINQFRSQRLGSINNAFDMENIEYNPVNLPISAIKYTQLSMNDILHVQDGLIQMKLDWIIAFLHLGCCVYDLEPAWSIYTNNLGDKAEYM